ncbi:hypothetical protein HPB52_011736 [Rhipicephalus sanguineus]|uniref:Uncharacterized protein n=1 Tax=Rhipicephalus sanguineus TaxID=34632 RepID=A0A9D4T7H4_RHISA|nr:hypothetical protein HPB52_011736 [Rhipicephalus sanguineus]
MASTSTGQGAGGNIRMVSGEFDGRHDWDDSKTDELSKAMSGHGLEVEEKQGSSFTLRVKDLERAKELVKSHNEAAATKARKLLATVECFKEWDEEKTDAVARHVGSHGLELESKQGHEFCVKVKDLDAARSIVAGHKPCAARVSTSDRTLDKAKFHVSITKNEPHHHVHVHLHIHLDLLDFALKFLTWLCQFVYDKLK